MIPPLPPIEPPPKPPPVAFIELVEVINLWSGKIYHQLEAWRYGRLLKDLPTNTDWDIEPTKGK